jgi:hypothetical protein
MRQALLATLVGLVLLNLAGCPSILGGEDDDAGTTSDNTGGAAGGTGDADDSDGESLADLVISYLGSLSGNANTLSTTKASTITESGHKIPGRALGTGAVGWITDLEGNRIIDPNGIEIAGFPVGPNGEFGPVPGLPVGVDLLLNIDEDGDGVPELITIINIPKDAAGDAGALADTACDPLSTLIRAKLYALMVARGIDPYRLGISASGLVERIRDAFEHLYAESGIDEEISIDDIANLSDEALATLFDQLIPELARRAMDMAVGNMRLALADTVEEVVKAVAEILVVSGFAVGDDPDGIDLSFLGDLPNVETISFQDFFIANNPGGDGSPDEPPPMSGQGAPPPPTTGPTVYQSTLGAFDRNFTDAEREQDKRRPMFNEHLLARMADAYLNGKTISLHNLYDVLVSLDGLGVRLTYMKFNRPGQPSINVFETADGTGVELDLRKLFEQIQALGLHNADPRTFEQKKAQLRTFLKDFFAHTVGPSFERLFEGVLMDRVPDPLTFATIIRDARAHLPFSRSGPAQLHVLADGDVWRGQDAHAITVDVTVDVNGWVTEVTYNAAGDGKYWLGFGPHTPGGTMLVHALSRDTGRPLHSRNGWMQELDLGDSSVFPVSNGESLLDLVSASHTGYPGEPALRLPNPGYNPDQPPDPLTNPPDFNAFVLVDQPGPEGEPVRVNYDGGVATYDVNGQWYLLFTERTPDEGLFELISESGEILQDTLTVETERVLVAATAIVGLDLSAQTFTNYFGVDVPNPGYDPTGAPYFDDFNDDGQQGAGEPSFDHRDFLWNADDWRSTRVDTYYRRGDNNGFFTPDQVDWGAPEPRLLDGTPLVVRQLRPRMNAFRFGNPNLTINLLTAFSPANFFDGTHSLNGDTRVNPFTAMALINLAFGSIHNVGAVVDFDGPGPMPPHPELIDAHVFVTPVGDPMQLIVDGFMDYATAQ